MTYLITFLEGVVTFISPCLLPLLPVYIAYFAGGVQANNKGTASSSSSSASSSSASSAATSNLTHTIVSALGFVFGFSLLFTLMGAFAGSIGSFFTANQGVLNVVCGLIVIFFGLHFMGLIKIEALQKTLRPNVNRPPRGFFSSALFGMVFAIGWTPCVGAFLGSALSLAASTGSTLQGVLLLLCYSLGLGLPFVLAAVLIDRLEGAFNWVKQHYTLVNRVCGALLIIVGILMASGQMGRWLSLLAG
ncbi:MAG: sulfite exporter TauE/SafE family protein [Eggerthellaceae bacterium]|nr:sulfite exporter TauE/SafE family protein [Eggerthellaceae bacterium]